VTVTRRGFIAGAAAGTAGLLISFHVPNVARVAPKAAQPLPSPNAFLRIGSDDSVTVLLAHSEMGQGIWTGLAMLIAEELDCDWSKVRSEHAPAAAMYERPGMGIQMTGGSSSTYSEFDRYRTVGATAKVLLLRAAATRWKTTPAKLSATNGVITFDGKTLTYGDVAEAAMKLPPPEAVKLKEPKEWKLIGTAVRRLDTPEKINGKAIPALS
jgi:isoquinoline 1-oxidoreductase beta subunit